MQGESPSFRPRRGKTARSFFLLTPTPRRATVCLALQKRNTDGQHPVKVPFFMPDLRREWSIRKDDRTFCIVFLSSRRLAGQGFQIKRKYRHDKPNRKI